MEHTREWRPTPFHDAVRWQSEEGVGIEHLDIRADCDSIAVESVVAGVRFGGSYGLWYQIKCAPDWSVRRVLLRTVGGSSLELNSDGQGNWTDAQGSSLPDLTGCIDIDISATPFTNTLPIRRLALEKSERRIISVVDINAPQLDTQAVQQAYTCLTPGRRYRYEGLFRSFVAELAVDDSGLVLDYSGLFTRIAANCGDTVLLPLTDKFCSNSRNTE